MDEKYLKLLEKQNRLIKVVIGLLVGIVVLIGVSGALIVPKMNKVLTETTEAVVKMDKIVTELEESDLPGLVQDTRKLVDQSNAGVAEAVEKIDALDIESLNEAIAGLKAVVEPLAKLFGH